MRPLTDAAADRDDYFPTAFVVSIAAHAVFLYLLLVGIQREAQPAPMVVYSVTMESGSTRGGISQIPQTDKQTPVAPPKKTSAPEVKEEKKETPPPEKTDPKVEKKAEPEEAEVSLKEKEEKKPEPVKKEPPKKETAKPAAKAASKTAPQKKQLTKAEIDRSYQQAMQRYLGASTDAGGQGFGAAGGVGKGMGGGIYKPPEWFLYKDKLEAAVKQGWKWHQPDAGLSASVQFKISPSGVISDLRIARASGNPKYDDSVLRAVAKASPVPPAPPAFYQDFSFVEIDFLPQ